MKDFTVKVYRYRDDGFCRTWDCWFFSKVYAIQGDRFLVYDDGSSSAYCDEETFCPGGFVWVDFTSRIPNLIDDGGEHLAVELVEDGGTGNAVGVLE